MPDDHDPLCPQRHQYRGHKSRCICVLLAAARADERERIVAELDGPAQERGAEKARREVLADLRDKVSSGWVPVRARGGDATQREGERED